jgi:23S rRNA (adenine2503-C2)-methyltransferase
MEKGLKDLVGLSRNELEAFFESIGEKAFRGRQVMRWIYQKCVKEIDHMSDLSKALRKKLKEMAFIGGLSLIKKEVSQDGTTKYLFELEDGQAIESVLIPDEERLTLCISTQVGCAMGCKFCVTGQMGFSRNLTPGEILKQILEVKRDLRSGNLTNIVLMGMGEPLANFEAVKKALSIMEDELALNLSARRITLSTVGLIPELRRLFEEGVRCRLAISLNAADQETRAYLMPISRKYPLQDLIECCRSLPIPPRDRITFEYVLIKDVNASPEDAKKLALLLKGIRCKINLIPLNEAPEIPFKAPSEKEVLGFQKILIQHGFTALIRESRGRDISAACGQLRGKVFKIKPS